VRVKLGLREVRSTERVWLATPPPGGMQGPGERFSTGHERKDSPTEMFSGNQMIAYGAV
jgi:hypothetical protein